MITKSRKKRIVISVMSDLATDQRIHRIALYLAGKGAGVLVIGRSAAGSPALTNRPYPAERIRCSFNKGVLLYAEFNLKLFFRLLFIPCHALLSNDLDTLLPNRIIAAMRRKPLVYDSHEYFTGMPTLLHRPFRRKVWKMMERTLLPGIKHAYTVNRSISEAYFRETGIRMEIVRNVPALAQPAIAPSILLPEGRRILLMQGGGINPEQGYEEAVQAMQYLPESYLLVIAGGGLLWDELQQMVTRLGLQDKVMMIPRVPFEKLSAITRQAHLGLCLTKPVSANHLMSLPNKLFDYIHAGLPVLATDVPEVKDILEQTGCGKCIHDIQPLQLAHTIQGIFENNTDYLRMKSLTIPAARTLNWEQEQKKLDKVYDPLLGD